MARIAVHSTHEAADKLGGIGSVLQGLLPEAAYQEVFPHSLLVGVYPFPGEHSVIDDPDDRAASGWEVKVDTAAGRRATGRLGQGLAEIAERYGIRLVHGSRVITKGVRTPVLLASPHGVRRELVDAFRAGLQRRLGFDLELFDDFPAVTDRVDRRLERLLVPGSAAPDLPERLIIDQGGMPFPGGASWADARALFPPITALDAFSGNGRANKYLLELQFHTFAAPALWEATRVLLREWAPAGSSYDSGQVTLFAHDWVGVPLYWAMRVAGETVGQTVYVAHEARIFRLLAEGALHDRATLLRAVCHPDGFDASLYPHLQRALEQGWDLATMFPGTVGFPDVFHHAINREAARFDRIVAVGPLIRDETTVALRPLDAPPVALCPNGVPTPKVTAAEAWAAHERLAEVAERHCGFRPDVIFTGVMRCELSKAPWRNVGLLRRFAERFEDRKAVFFWLSAPKPRPTRTQVQRWATGYEWPLQHRGGAGGDLRPEEEGLWTAIEALNSEFDGQAAMLYINQFGWSADALGALDPGQSTFADLRCGTDLEVGLSIYEPFGIAPLEPYAAGAVCLLSDACGCAAHLRHLALADTVVLGRFTSHGVPPREVDATALREIEQAAYDQMLVDAAGRLGLAEPLTRESWLTRREARIKAAQAGLERLSWKAAVERYLLPALLTGPV